MNGTFRFTPRLESLDGRLLPGGVPGGVVNDTHRAGVAVAVRPAADAAQAGGVVSDTHGEVSGVNTQSVRVGRNSGEEIPQ